MNTSGSHLIQY